MATPEILTASDIPHQLFEVLSNPQTMNPVVPDLGSLVKPPNAPDELWAVPEYRPDYIQEFPHPPYLVRMYCSGNDQKGNLKNHLARVEVVAWRWKPQEETGYGYGLWVPDDSLSLPLTGWIPPSQTPESYQFGANNVKVRPDGGHGCCPTCAQGRLR